MTTRIDAFKLYEKSVQDTSFEINLINETYHEWRGHYPLVLREDFCGTGLLSCDWVKQQRNHSAIAIDLCAETLAYGRRNHFPKLTRNEQNRLRYLKRDVLHCDDIHSDVVAALNFSYWTFQSRQLMRNYFSSVRSSLNEEGLFILDVMGGSEIVTIQKETKRFGDFTYYWECEDFNPITFEAHYAIHFKPKGKPFIKRAFAYYWRVWSIPEITELLREAGFTKSVIYWEEEDKRGKETGRYIPVQNARHDLVWIAYIVAGR